MISFRLKTKNWLWMVINVRVNHRILFWILMLKKNKLSCNEKWIVLLAHFTYNQNLHHYKGAFTKSIIHLGINYCVVNCMFAISLNQWTPWVNDEINNFMPLFTKQSCGIINMCKASNLPNRWPHWSIPQPSEGRFFLGGRQLLRKRWRDRCKKKTPNRRQNARDS